MADAITGLYAALGIAGALVERGRTGHGVHLEISMLEAMMHFAVEPFTGYFALGEVPTALDRPRLAQAFIVRCSDGKLLAIHLSSMDKFWDALVEAIDGQALAADPCFAVRQSRIDNYVELLAELNAIFGRRPRADFIAAMSRFDVPFAPVNSIAEAAADPQVAHLQMIVPVTERREGAEQAIRPPFAFDGSRADAVAAAPLIDQHGSEIRSKMQSAPGTWPERGRLDEALA